MIATKSKHLIGFGDAPCRRGEKLLVHVCNEIYLIYQDGEMAKSLINNLSDAKQHTIFILASRRRSIFA